jgi:hypothetical protein
MKDDPIPTTAFPGRRKPSSKQISRVKAKTEEGINSSFCDT